MLEQKANNLSLVAMSEQKKEPCWRALEINLLQCTYGWH
jgi:hypothetical protein